MIRLTTVVEDRDLRDALNKAEFSVSQTSLGSFMSRVVHPHLQNRMDQRFANEGDSAVGKWDQLAFRTGMIRANQGFPPWHPINRRTGDLQNALRSSHRITPGDSGAALTIPDRLPKLIATKLKVAQRGGKGSNRNGVDAPARPVLGLDERDRAYIVPTLSEWISRGGA